MDDGINKKISAFYLLLLIILVYFAGFNFPVPWIDESAFLLQAYSFTKTNSLLSPYLSPERTIMWLPPGYLILMGLVFKITGFSLRIARSVSFFFTFLSFIFAIKIIDKLEGNVFLKIMLLVFFLHPAIIAMANVARPEAIYFALAIIAGYLLLSERQLAALSVAIFSGLFHFNGLYVAVLSLSVIIASCVRNKNNIVQYIAFQFKKKDLLLFTTAVIAWLAYGLLIIGNFGSFVHDMTFQFKAHAAMLKLSSPPFLKSSRSLFFIFLFCLTGIYSLIKQKFNIAIISGFSLACYLLNGIGQEMWYGVFFVLSFSFLFVALYLVLKVENYTVTRAAIILLIAVIPFFMITRTAQGYSFFGMKYIFKKAYLTQGEITYIKDSLLSIQKKRNSGVPLTVRFIKPGDGLLFLAFLEKNNFSLIQNLPIVKSRKVDIEVCINKKDYNPQSIDLINSNKMYRETDHIRIFYNGSPYSTLR
jgi:hypothetical protein